MTATSSRQVVLKKYPHGQPEPDCFELQTVPRPVPGAGDLLLRVTDLSLDPYLRTALTGNHVGSSATALGDLVPGRSVAEVVESGDPAVPPGSWVLAETGWREWATVPAAAASPFEPVAGVRRSAVLGALGMPGLTAYAAITRMLRPVVGDTVVISSATGGVGSLAGQLARRSGARTVALVGSSEKAGLARDLFGYDEAVLRTSATWRQELADACPDGVDGYLHMADGDVLDGVIGQLAVGARLVLCGLMDQYNDGPATTLRAGPLVGARATVFGMVVYDHQDLAEQHRRRVGPLIVAGDVKMHEDRYVGLEQAPYAFAQMMSGRNVGKVVVEVTG